MKQFASRFSGVVLLPLIAAMVAVAAAAGTAAHVEAESPATVRLDPPSSRVDWSDGPFQVRIDVNDLDHHGEVPYDDNRDTVPDRTVPSDGLAALEFLLVFDPAVLRVEDVQAGDFIRSAGRAVYCFTREPAPGQFAVGCASTGSAPGPQGSGTLATVTLVPLADGSTFLGLLADLAGPLGDPIDVTVEGGVVEVFGGPEATPTPEVTPTPDPNATPEAQYPGPTVIGDGELSDVTLPQGDPGPAAGNDGGDASANALPSTGTAYQASDAGSMRLLLGAVLAAAGMAMLFFGLRLGTPAQRP